MLCERRERKQRRNAEIRESLNYGLRAAKITTNYLAHLGLTEVRISTQQ